MKSTVSMTVGALIIALLLDPGFAQEPTQPRAKMQSVLSSRSNDIARVEEMIAQLEEIELAIKSREIACKLAEIGIATAKITEKQLELRMKDADSREREPLQLELQKSALHTETCKRQYELAKLQLDSARAGLKRFKNASARKASSKPEVRIEYIDEPGVLILRGAKEDVKKIQGIIEKLDVK